MENKKNNSPLLAIIVMEIDSGKHPPAAKRVIPITESGKLRRFPKIENSISQSLSLVSFLTFFSK